MQLPRLRRRVGAEARGRAAAGAPRKPRGPSLARLPRPRPTCTSGAPPRRAGRRPWPLPRSPPPAAGLPVASAASAAVSRTRRSSSRTCSRAGSAQSAYGSSPIAVPADSSSCARSAAASATAAAVASFPSAWSQRRAAASRSTTMPGAAASRYPARPPWMSSAPSTARSLLTRVATFCSGAVGRSFGHRTSTIRSSGTRPGRSTASSLSSVRDFRLPISPSVSSMPSRTTLNVPARRNSTHAALTDPAGPDLPTCTSYRWPARRARDANAMTSTGTSAVTRLRPGSGGPGRTARRTRAR